MIATIFDIDGTLVQTSAFDDRCYIQAVREVLGHVPIHDDWDKYEKVTDTGILLQILRENNIQDTSCIAKVKTRFTDLIRSCLNDADACHPTRGAREFIQRLCAHDAYKVGFATGGWGCTARLKLQHAGFVVQNQPLTSSDDSDERTEIMKKCLNTLGHTFQKVVYFGDAPWDLIACNTLNWNFIGVGKRLKNKCNLWINDFSDHNTILTML